jgi:tetratricopeptide (TPR) repeat protein/tRNA A-37 threonylcarbamoyl transferase component Bud32
MATETADSDTRLAHDQASEAEHEAGLRYQILRSHARGGLGEVYVAVDQELHREVALKEIQPQLADEANNRTRFVREAQITGSLEHPGIVPVYGLGQHADGRPYYAMRFIQGETLKEAIQRVHQTAGEHRLELRQLLSRFVAVCNAVAYAHSRGIIHRDLKPSNIMLGKYGETLVVDWGLAKALGKQATGIEQAEVIWQPMPDSHEPTQIGLALGTPAYMSPEQAMGSLHQLGPASDISSLGATFYTLLTGRAPFSNSDAVVVMQQVQAGDWPPPRSVKKDIPLALDAICRKAMALQPTDRYATALALAEDIEHWLADEPVQAYQEPWTTRLGRWSRRHRLAVTGVAAALLATLLLGGGSWWWQAQQHAKRQAEQTQLTNQALDEASRLWGQARADDQALVRWTEALAAAQRADDLVAGGEVEPGLSQRVAELRRNLEQDAQAARARVEIAAQDRNLREGLAQVRTERGEEFSRVETSDAYARIFRDQGLDVETLSVEEAAARLRVRSPRVVVELASALDDWALVLREAKQPAARWRKLLEVACAVDSDEWRCRMRIALAHEDQPALLELVKQADVPRLPIPSVQLLVLALRRAGQDDQAVAVLRKAQRRHPEDVWLNYTLAEVLHNQTRHPAPRGWLAFLERQPTSRGQLTDEQRMAILDEAIGFYRAAQAQRPEIAHNLAHALDDRGCLDEAIAMYRELTERQPNNGRHFACLGEALSRKGNIAEAQSVLEEAIRLHPGSAVSRTKLGDLLMRQEKWDAAIAAFHEALRGTPSHAAAYIGLAVALASKNQLEEALAAVRWAVFYEPDNANAYYMLGTMAFNNGKLDESLAAFRQTVRLRPDMADAYYGLASVLRAKGQLDEAVAAYQRTLRLQPNMAEAHCDLGCTLQSQGRLTEALASLKRGHQLGSQQRDWPHPSAAWVRKCEQVIELDKRLAVLLRGEGKPANPQEQIALAELCQQEFKGLYVTAARWYEEAFRNAPEYAVDPRTSVRYNAA